MYQSSLLSNKTKSRILVPISGYMALIFSQWASIFIGRFWNMKLEAAFKSGTWFTKYAVTKVSITLSALISFKRWFEAISKSRSILYFSAAISKSGSTEKRKIVYFNAQIDQEVSHYVQNLVLFAVVETT